MFSSEASSACPYKLPSKYKYLEDFGEGGFGMVLKCLDMETNEIVAIKYPRYFCEHTTKEISMLRWFKNLNFDKHNIVKYITSFPTKFGKAFVFEPLDISLHDFCYMADFAPMLLSDIRTIIQQMATALKALKRIEVIHSDIKLDNIMMVNHQLRPFEVKLIDFGLSFSKLRIEADRILQPPNLRPPEIILGSPFSEAIDMWSLGCVMFQMICGEIPFSGRHEYDILARIVQLIGQPADQVLKNGQWTKTFFNEQNQVWTLKPPLEYFRYRQHFRGKKSHEFPSLDALKEMRLEENNKTEAEEREQCIELLKAMLKVNADERITPCEVLTHPFITKDNPNVQTDMVKPSTSFEYEPPAAPLKDEDSIQPDNCTQAPVILPSGMILVSPATAENKLLLEDQESTVSEPPVAPLKDEDCLNIQPDDCTKSPEILPSSVILAPPVTAENTLLLEGQESTASGPPVAPLKDEDSLSIQRDNCNQFPEILTSGVILAPPVTAENTLLLEGQESTVSEPPVAPLTDEDCLNIQPDDCTQSPEILPSSVILAPPVTAENTLLLEGQESTVSEPPVAPLTDEDCLNIQPDDCTQSPEILPSSVILAPPVTAENTLLLEGQESTVSEPPVAPLKDEDSLCIQRDNCNQFPEFLTSGVILVRPATAENTLLLEDQESKVSEPPVAPLKDKDSLKIQPDDCTKSPEILPSSVILAPPVTAENTLLLEDQESTASEPPVAPLKDEDSLGIQRDNCNQFPEFLTSGVILVRPATAENTLLLEEQESTVSEPPVAPLKDEDSLNIQRDNCNQFPEFLTSGVILVRPATAENTLLLEDQESTASEPPVAPLKDEDSLNIQRDNCTRFPEILTSGVILAPPVTAENTLLLEDQDSTVSEPPVVPLTDEDSLNIQPDNCNQFPEILTSGVIMVRPATAESGLNKTSEYNSDSNTKISEDSTTCEDTGTKKKKKKKKKNFFCRAFSWLRKKTQCFPR